MGKSKIQLNQVQNGKYEVFLNGQSIGTIALSRNSFHAGNLYLQLDLNTYDVSLSTDIFKQLWKEQENETRFQMMCESSETELIRFIESAGFLCKRRCYECEVSENEWKQEPEFFAEIQQYVAGDVEYEKACELLYQQYAAKHEKINPLTAAYNDFIEKLPKKIYAEASENQIQNFAFVEENEIAYVGRVNKETYATFLASVVKHLFSEYDTIFFEADDTDPEAMQLKEMFEPEDEESYNTYIMERTEA